MGLLSEGEFDGDRQLALYVCRVLAKLWDEEFATPWGYEITIFSRGIDRSCHLASEHLFTDETFPKSPGPFKRAAAFAILLRQQVEIEFRPVAGNDPMSDAQKEAWMARLALLAIPIILKMSNIKGKRLVKNWVPATEHLRCEVLAWLRWLKPPLVGASAIDIARLCRSILVFAMVIEQSYYLVGAEVNCEIMGICGCEVDTTDEVVGPDAFFIPVKPQV